MAALEADWRSNLSALFALAGWQNRLRIFNNAEKVIVSETSNLTGISASNDHNVVQTQLLDAIRGEIERSKSELKLLRDAEAAQAYDAMISREAPWLSGTILGVEDTLAAALKAFSRVPTLELMPTPELFDEMQRFVSDRENLHSGDIAASSTFKAASDVAAEYDSLVQLCALRTKTADWVAAGNTTRIPGMGAARLEAFEDVDASFIAETAAAAERATDRSARAWIHYTREQMIAEGKRKAAAAIEEEIAEELGWTLL